MEEKCAQCRDQGGSDSHVSPVCAILISPPRVLRPTVTAFTTAHTSHRELLSHCLSAVSVSRSRMVLRRLWLSPLSASCQALVLILHVCHHAATDLHWPCTHSIAFAVFTPSITHQTQRHPSLPHVTVSHDAHCVSNTQVSRRLPA